jgi:hyperosmotically inducible protein
MKTRKLFFTLLTLLAIGTLAGCSGTSAKSPDVSDSIRKSLDQSGLKNVSVTQDRDKGVVTLGGNVPANGDKLQAESIAKSIATGQVVADEIAVIPPGVERDAKTVNSDLDQGIEKNLDAALIQKRLQKGVKYEVKNGVVTLSGDDVAFLFETIQRGIHAAQFHLASGLLLYVTRDGYSVGVISQPHQYQHYDEFEIGKMACGFHLFKYDE